MSNGVNFRKLALDLRDQLNLVTAERDAALAQLSEQQNFLHHEVLANDHLQQRLTAADEANEKLSAAYFADRERIKLLEGVLREIRQACELSKLRDAQIDAALKPAEPMCPKCNDTGETDSGGVQPWGEGINIPCDCKP